MRKLVERSTHEPRGGTPGRYRLTWMAVAAATLIAPWLGGCASRPSGDGEGTRSLLEALSRSAEPGQARPGA
ncbi:MAG TPA: hypothetical protein VJA26_08085, partial [Gammaproteobacteria bacterium]|nr:hypothetical protein [Gammaproteobacteria bacterium]